MELRRKLCSPGGAAPPGLEVVIVTAVVTAAVVPFVKELATKAADDAYAGVCAWLDRLFAEKRSEPDSSYLVKNHLLIVEDPDPRLNLALHLWTDTPDEAIHALVDLDIDTVVRRSGSEHEKVRGLWVYWNQNTRSWQILDR